MGGEIIADKFALLKTRGSNGVAFTHIVEDTLLGERAVVKVSDKLGLLTLEYLKTVNLVREMDIPGLLMPFEGGILDEEDGYYLAYPEVGEPSLENYLHIGIPITCAEAAQIVEQVLDILEVMHAAGFYHLFIDTRNIFYRARGQVTLKDPCLKADFFYSLLELVAAPDFSYLSPGVMDGAMPNAQDDLYAVGRLAERLLEEAVDTEVSSQAGALRRAAEERHRVGKTGGSLSAGNIREELARLPQDADIGTDLSFFSLRKDEKTSEDINGDLDREIAVNVSGKHGKGMRRWVGLTAGIDKKVGKRRVRLAVTLSALLVMLVGFTFFVRPFGEVEGKGARFTAGSSSNRSDVIHPELWTWGGSEEDDIMQASLDSLDVDEKVEQGKGEPAMTQANGEGQVEERQALDNVPATPSQSPQYTTEASVASPLASFSMSPSQGQSPLQVYLDASSSYDPDGYIVSYTWNFGGKGPALYYVFESSVIPANRAVTLTVTDNGGHSASTTLYVTLY
jgi:hypothetical protein